MSGGAESSQRKPARDPCDPGILTNPRNSKSSNATMNALGIYKTRTLSYRES